MKSGDRIRFELDHPPPFFPIFPEGPGEVPKQRVKGTFYGEWFHICLLFQVYFVLSCSFSFFSLNQIDVEMCVEAHVFEGAATAVVFSSGVELTAGHTTRMNNYVHERGLGLGAVFVHTITLTDVAHNGLVNIVLVFSFFGFLYFMFF